MEIKLLSIPNKFLRHQTLLGRYFFFISLYDATWSGHPNMLAYMIPTASVDKTLAPRQRRPHPTLAAATSKGSLDKKEETQSRVFSNQDFFTSTWKASKISPYDTSSLRQALTLANPGAPEFCLLEKRKSHESGGRRSQQQQDEEAARRQTLTLGRVTRPDPFH